MSRKSQLAQEIEVEHTAGTPVVNFLGAQKNPVLVDGVMFTDQIAKSRMIIRNVTFPKALEVFQHEPQFQTIERYFPIAEGGPLYVDTAYEPDVLKACEKKKKIMKEHKLRYLVLTKGMDVIEAQKQLGGK